MKKLLILDDDRVFASVVGEAMVRQGFMAKVANSAADGLAMVAEFLPEYILLDLKIAAESGLKMIPELLAVKGDVKIVILTGYANIQTAIEAIKLGAIYYLSKPASINEILSAFDKGPGNSAIKIESETVPLNRLERTHIETVLAKNSGNISAAARELKMHRRTLQRKLSKKA